MQISYSITTNCVEFLKLFYLCSRDLFCIDIIDFDFKQEIWTAQVVEW